jgi:hypothetical protein
VILAVAVAVASYFCVHVNVIVNIWFLLFFPFLVWQLDVLPPATIGTTLPPCTPYRTPYRTPM